MSPLLLNRCAPRDVTGGGCRRVAARRWTRSRRAGAPSPPAGALHFTLGLAAGAVLVLLAHLAGGVVG